MTAQNAKNARKKAQVKDLRPRAVKSSKAASVKGGKPTMQDLNITKTVDKSSAKLY